MIPSPSTAGGGGHQEVTYRIISSAENDRDDESNASPNVEELPYDSSLPSLLSSSSYQIYDIQNLARWIEHVHPFSLLQLLVFVRQHLQGGESVLIGMTVMLKLYWAYGLVREVAMVFKCMLLLYYKNGRGHNYRKQVQMLTVVEYLLILYRALLPTPVWHLFFLKKEYGSFFSSPITGLYLTVKLTTVLWKVQLFFTAWRTLPLKEMYYGSYATSEQVKAVGDLCAICQEKMHAPILLRCKHIL
ncbi:hypothetical protein NC651_040599 [Populus alba x Populus x berolinensis]|nr:hypothetical protein NC651_040599 [Populus alba x Populus x berolinensis]